MPASRIQAAFDLMTRAHAGQTRKGGRPYATHPAAVRQILVDELGVTDEDAQVAALLHDVVEDTPVTVAQVEETFGPRVAAMVDVLTKPPVSAEAIVHPTTSAAPPAQQTSPGERLIGRRPAGESALVNTPGQNEPIARGTDDQLLVDVEPPAAHDASPNEAKAAMLARYYARLRAADVPVRQIKLADRVHNLREMGASTAAFRAKYLRETLLLLDDVLAGTPGIGVLRAEYERCAGLYGNEGGREQLR